MFFFNFNEISSQTCACLWARGPRQAKSWGFMIYSVVDISSSRSYFHFSEAPTPYTKLATGWQQLSYALRRCHCVSNFWDRTKNENENGRRQQQLHPWGNLLRMTGNGKIFQPIMSFSFCFLPGRRSGIKFGISARLGPLRISGVCVMFVYFPAVYLLPSRTGLSDD